MKKMFILFLIVFSLPVSIFAQEVNNRKTAKDYNLFIAGKVNGKFSTDAAAMEIEPYGVNGGIEVNMQVNKWFAFMPVVDVLYTSGNNKGIDAESIAVGVKTYLLFQPEVKDNGFQPFAGIAPTFTLCTQEVIDNNNNFSKCSYMKNYLGVGAVVGFNYIYNNFITGLNLEYNYILAGSKDDKSIHLDLASGFSVGLRFGYRF